MRELYKITMNQACEYIASNVAEDKKISMAKARKKREGAKNFKLRTYCLDGFIYVNPQYLFDMLEALPDAVAYHPGKPVNPIYFQAYNGDGILCPVRKPVT